MKRPKQHQIDELAQRVFRDALPAEWVAREQRPDYGIDYLVEIGKSEKLTGLAFAVQLKGKKTLAHDGESILYQSLETRHLAYYLDKQRAPVFLVLVDVVTHEGYWLFLQRYALEHLKDVDWRRQTTVTLRLPAANSLKNIDALERAVEEADHLMAELRPSAVQGAITAERKRMETLDPRIRVEVSATEGGVTTT
jgi:hypothetical protein